MGSFDKSVKIRLRLEKHGTLGWGCWVEMRKETLIPQIPRSVRDQQKQPPVTESGDSV